MSALRPPKPLINTIDALGNRLLAPPFGGLGQIRNHGSRNQRTVALTFDDGPSTPCTEEMLEALDSLDVKATFFCVGVNARWHPQTVQKAYAAGHVIGNHSMYHSRKAGLLPVGGGHIDAAEDAIYDAIGVRPRLYRPPWGWLTWWESRRLHQRGYTIVGWDVYTLDWHWPEENGEGLAKKARQDARPGSILLFHDANAGVEVWHKTETLRAVKNLVPALRADGYTFVTVSEMLGVAPYTTHTSSSTPSIHAHSDTFATHNEQ